VLNHTMVIDLLTNKRNCVGALAVDKESNFLTLRARSVILGTGGATQLYGLSYGTRELTGDGYAMVYRAGAELANMEFMQIGFRARPPG